MSASLPAVRSSALARVNPVAKMFAAAAISAVLLLSVDWVSAAVTLLVFLVLVPFAGLPPRQFWLRTASVWLAAPLAAVTTVLYGLDSGRVLVQFGMISVTDGSLAFGVAILLRVLALGLPGVVLFATTDPGELADALTQLLHLPSRFVYGALAALRLVGLFAEDWRSLGLARRARGVADGGGIAGRARRLGGKAFALLVLAVRRGSKLATAMEARGFGAPIRRTSAQPSRFRRSDWAFLLIGVAAAGTAFAVSFGVGAWTPVLG